MKWTTLSVGDGGCSVKWTTLSVGDGGCSMKRTTLLEMVYVQ